MILQLHPVSLAVSTKSSIMSVLCDEEFASGISVRELLPVTCFLGTGKILFCNPVSLIEADEHHRL